MGGLCLNKKVNKPPNSFFFTAKVSFVFSISCLKLLISSIILNLPIFFIRRSTELI